MNIPPFLAIAVLLVVFLYLLATTVRFLGRHRHCPFCHKHGARWSMRHRFCREGEVDQGMCQTIETLLCDRCGRESVLSRYVWDPEDPPGDSEARILAQYVRGESEEIFRRHGRIEISSPV